MEQTGEIVTETEQFMMMRRCGIKDVQDNQGRLMTLSLLPGTSRHKRYALQGSRWKTKTLTYKIPKYSSKICLSKIDVDLTIKRDLNVWAVKTNLEFVKKVSGRVHLDIRFGV